MGFVDARKVRLATHRRAPPRCIALLCVAVRRRSFDPLIMLTIVGVQRNSRRVRSRRGGTAGVVDNWLREPVGPIHWASTETADRGDRVFSAAPSGRSACRRRVVALPQADHAGPGRAGSPIRSAAGGCSPLEFAVQHRALAAGRFNEGRRHWARCAQSCRTG